MKQAEMKMAVEQYQPPSQTAPVWEFSWVFSQNTTSAELVDSLPSPIREVSLGHETLTRVSSCPINQLYAILP